MRVHGVSRRSIRPLDEDQAVEIIDQTALPHAFRLLRLVSFGEVAQAIRTMQVRGAPLIGVAAAYGVALALREKPDGETLAAALATLAATRPTAVNLRWALDRQRTLVTGLPEEQRADAAWREAAAIAAEDVHRYAQKAIRAMDDVWAQKKAEVPSTVQQGPTRIVEVDGLPTLQRGATVIDCGLTLDQIRERLRGVMAVLFEASRTHSRVIWY